jgi:predicted component of type VI protein secretion system
VSDSPAFTTFIEDFERSKKQIETVIRQAKEEYEPRQDLVRPGVIAEHAYERTGVTHLVHAWHEQGRKGSEVRNKHILKIYSTDTMW